MPLPEIIATETLATTRFFKIEALDLRYSNGVERRYERLPAGGAEGVFVVAVNAQNELLLIREYAAGFHEMQLTLPKGLVEPEESMEAAATRELAEEAGFAAKHAEFIKRLTLAPGHMGFAINVVFATGLYPKQLQGDEPEPIELVPWPLQRLDELLSSEEFCEARALAALALCRPLFSQLLDAADELIKREN